jgi:hypothetical protein
VPPSEWKPVEIGGGLILTAAVALRLAGVAPFSAVATSMTLLSAIIVTLFRAKALANRVFVCRAQPVRDRRSARHIASVSHDTFATHWFPANGLQAGCLAGNVRCDPLRFLFRTQNKIGKPSTGYARRDRRGGRLRWRMRCPFVRGPTGDNGDVIARLGRQPALAGKPSFNPARPGIVAGGGEAEIAELRHEVVHHTSIV